MNDYIAHNDPIWVDGHFVERWEQRYINNLPNSLELILKTELSAGNRVTSAHKGETTGSSSIWFVFPIRASLRINHNQNEIIFLREEDRYQSCECFYHIGTQSRLLFPID